MLVLFNSQFTSDLRVICRVQIVKKGSKIDISQQQTREKDSNSDKYIEIS
jgi:hypothetical protein